VSIRLLAAAVVLLVVPGCGGSDRVPADAIAVVDGQPVSKSDYEELLAQSRKSYETQKRPFPKAGSHEYETLEDQFVQFLVQRVRFEQQAAELEIEVTSKQVNERLDQIIEQYFGGARKKYRAQLESQGLTERQVRADIRAQIVSEGIFAQVTKAVKVNDRAISAHYEKNQAQYSKPESREVRHILVKTRALALEVQQQLRDGADFGTLARKYSMDTGSKQNGGRLTVARGQTVAPFDQTAFLLPVNRISGPVRTEFGYHLIQPISEVQEATRTPLKDVRESIRQQLLQARRNEAMTTWVEETNEELGERTRYQTGFAPPAKTARGGTLEITTAP